MSRHRETVLFRLVGLGVLLLAAGLAQISCGGHSSQMMPPVPTSPGPSTGGTVPAGATDICNCTDTQPDSTDFRFVAKHVPLPPIGASDIAVADMLNWSGGAEPAFDAPRQGRELQMFHIPNGFLQFAWMNTGDCDLHLEISDSPDKNAPRVIVETPHMDTFCGARRQLAAQLSARGFTLSSNSGELATAVPVDVLGLAFRDFNHSRGTVHVATMWELHPAVVSVK